MDKKYTYLNIFCISKALSILSVVLSWLAIAIDIGIRAYTGIIINNIRNIKANTIIQIIFLSSIYIVCKFFLPYVNTRLDTAVTNHIYWQLEEKALNASQQQADKIEVGTAATLFTSDIPGIIRYIQRVLTRFVPDTLMLVLSLLTIFIANPILGVTTFLSAIIPAVLMTAISRYIAPRSFEYQKAVENVNSKISEDLYNLEYIKANQIETDCINKIGKLLSDLLKKKKKLQFIDGILSSPALLTSFLAVVVVSLLGGYLVTTKQLSIGTLFVVISLIGYVTSPIMSLGNSLSQIKKASANFKRINEFLSIKQETEKAENYIFDPLLRQGTLKIKNITFGYGDRKIFEDYSVTFYKGRLNVFVGRNGCGKSTLIKLLSNLYDLDCGYLSTNLEEENINRFELREKIVFDSQEIVLFEDTILGNLTRNLPMDIVNVHKVCEAVGIHYEILNMEKGYETFLKPGGDPLSGGQKRRLCLARSLLRKAQIYIFDEPTTGVDDKCIEIIVNTLRSLSKAHLVIVVSHEPMLIQAAERIIEVGDDVES